MDEFEKKYGVKANELVKEFHRSRRMFCIHQGKLIIAEPGLDYSHAVWFEKEGWISRGDDSLMDQIIRGIVEKDGNISFYIGYDFRVDEEVEKGFFPYLIELVEKLDVGKDAEIFGGYFMESPGGELIPRRKYGLVKDLVNR